MGEKYILHIVLTHGSCIPSFLLMSSFLQVILCPLSWYGEILAVGGRQDNNRDGATWVFAYDESGGYTQSGDKLVGTPSESPVGPFSR